MAADADENVLAATDVPEPDMQEEAVAHEGEDSASRVVLREELSRNQSNLSLGSNSQ